MSDSPLILVVDDEAQIRKFLRISLTAHGYRVIDSGRGADALAKCGTEVPDLMILDLGLPDMSGRDVVKRVREWTRFPILILSVRADEPEKVAALEAGANDYVTKPFGIAELIARVRVLLRDRSGAAPTEPSSYAGGGLEIDYAARRVRVDGAEVQLARKEFDLLRRLAQSVGTVLTHEQLLREIWGESHTGETQYLRVHVGRLRQKLGDDPNAPRFIWTEPGVGYRLIAES